MIVVSFIAGCFVGGSVSMVAFGLAVAASRADEIADAEVQKILDDRARYTGERPVVVHRVSVN